MKKKGYLCLLALAAGWIFYSCNSMPSVAPAYKDPRLDRDTHLVKAAAGSDPFHINRYFQSEAIPKGASIGILNGSGSSSVFLAAALQEAGLNVRQYDLYSMLSYSDISLTNPQGRFVYKSDLAGDASEVVKTAAQDAAADGAESTDINVDALIDRLFDLDDLLVEGQRVDHYLALKSKLRALLDSMKLDYIIISGSMYQEHDYETYIYKTSNLDLVFSHIIVADIDEWRKVLGEPGQKENLTFSFTDESEPVPFYDMAYCEYLAGILNIK